MYRESRLRFLMRTQSAAFTVRFVIGDARRLLRGKFFFIQSRQGCRVDILQNGCVFLRSKNTVVSGLSQKSVTFSTAYEFKIKSLYRNDLILNIA